jgi:predicted amidohydrolase
MRKVKAALIQMNLKGDPATESIETVRDKMVAAHLSLIEEAARQGVQVIGLQEVFNTPYFPATIDDRWFESAEAVPDGPTTRAMCEAAKKHGMVIVSPVYERDRSGRRYNTAAVIDADGEYLGKFRKIHIPKIGKYDEKYYFADGDLGYPVFDTAIGKVGVYICYDRHFPEGWRALALERRRGDLQPVGDRAGPERPSLDPGAAGGGGRELRLYRCQQPRRHGAAVEQRPLLRLQLLRQSARRDPDPGAGRSGRVGHSRSRPRHDRRGAGGVEVLSRAAARYLWRGRVLAGLSAGAELVFNPSATFRGVSDHIWNLEQVGAAIANGIFIGTNNRVGTEPSLGNHVFYGSSYFCNPRGEILAQGGDEDDELVVAALDLDQIREVRDTWQFFRDRRPETYQHCARQP